MTYSLQLEKLTRRTASGLSFAAVLLVANTFLHAGEITAWNWFPGIASVALDPVAAPVDPNNDDVVGESANKLLVTQKAYFAVGPVDIEFSVVPSGGVTEYTIFEGVDNDTTIDWSSYRLELGFGVGTSFVLSPSGDGLDFDSPDFNSDPNFSAFFPTVIPNEDVLFATGGVFPSPGFTTPLFRFSIDVPDGISAFTLRQRPIAVPEAGTMTLALLSSLAFIRRLRLRQEAAVGSG